MDRRADQRCLPRPQAFYAGVAEQIADHVRYRVYLDYARPNGTLREQLEQVAAWTGVVPQELLDEPLIPQGFAGLVEVFWKLNTTSAGEPITYSEMLAFADLDGYPINPEEAEILSQCSRAYAAEMQKIRESKI